MAALVFSMAGVPRGQGRPRATAARGYASVYKAGADKKYEASVRAVAQAAMAGREPFEGPLSVALRFRMPIPKSANRRTRDGMAAGEIAPTTKPDWDNAAKAICDAMNTVVFVDDCQIVRAFVTKIYAERPGVDVKVEAFAPQDGAA